MDTRSRKGWCECGLGIVRDARRKMAGGVRINGARAGSALIKQPEFAARDASEFGIQVGKMRRFE